MALGYVSYAAPVASTPSTLGVSAQPSEAVRTAVANASNSAVATGFDPRPADSGVIGGGGAYSGAVTLNAVGAQYGPSAVTAAQNTISGIPDPEPDNPASVARAVPAPAASLGSPVTMAQTANTAVSNQFGAPMANEFSQASVNGGGPISDALQSGVAKIAAYAQNGMKSIEQAIQADMAANNGQVDPVKMQQYTMQMSTYELITQMAAKIQEKQERALQVWLR